MVRKPLGYDDHAGAGTPHRHAGSSFLLEGLSEVVDVDQLDYGGALAPGDYQAVDLVQLFGQTYLP